MAFLSPRQMIDELNIKPGSTIVDLGSGSGAYVYEACRANKINTHNGKIIAVDIDKDKLDMIRDTARVGGFIVEQLMCDLEDKLIIPDYSADYIILANTLHMIENRESLMRECSRILAPKGYMLFVEWTGDKKSIIGPKDESIIRKETAVQVFKKCNLEVVLELQAGDYHYAFILKN
jgi:ubiquinone/menaquinone biosynthesis C-methylase UbiE